MGCQKRLGSTWGGVLRTIRVLAPLAAVEGFFKGPDDWAARRRPEAAWCKFRARQRLGKGRSSGRYRCYDAIRCCCRSWMWPLRHCAEMLPVSTPASHDHKGHFQDLTIIPARLERAGVVPMAFRVLGGCLWVRGRLVPQRCSQYNLHQSPHRTWCSRAPKLALMRGFLHAATMSTLQFRLAAEAMAAASSSVALQVNIRRPIAAADNARLAFHTECLSTNVSDLHAEPWSRPSEHLVHHSLVLHTSIFCPSFTPHLPHTQLLSPATKQTALAPRTAGCVLCG